MFITISQAKSLVRDAEVKIEGLRKRKDNTSEHVYKRTMSSLNRELAECRNLQHELRRMHAHSIIN